MGKRCDLIDGNIGTKSVDVLPEISAKITQIAINLVFDRCDSGSRNLCSSDGYGNIFPSETLDGRKYEF